MTIMNIDNIKFAEILRLYCGEKAKALEWQEEEKYRGCRIWSFKRRITKWRWKNTSYGSPYWKMKEEARSKNEAMTWKWSDIPDDQKESYIDEFWMALTNYDLYFEEDCSGILQGQTREEAINRLQHQIDEQYAESMATEDIM
jgi:hypothetical protein